MSRMTALTFDRSREDWSSSRGMVLEQIECPKLTDAYEDQEQVIIKVKYAGFCGSDRGIWSRKAFGDMVLGSLEQDGQTKRVFGHEMLGEIVEIGPKVSSSYGYRVGDVVSTESHIVCGTCHQCRLGEYHVCANDRIIGISLDGCFAEYVKLPAKALWRTDLDSIRPEVAAIQEPFGNAVHACQVTDLRGKTVAVLGTGTIGLFAVLIAKGMGARKVIGVEPNPHRKAQAEQLGCDVVLTPDMPPADQPWKSDPGLREQILELTNGVGVDVALEMAGFNSSLNNAIQMTRRGGRVVLFGVQNGNAVIEDAHRVIMNGIKLQGVVGRRLFQTWHMTQALLESSDNGIQQAVWDVILNKGEGPIVDINDWTRDSFEKVIHAYPKPVIKFS